jgi:hypothetical protein
MNRWIDRIVVSASLIGGYAVVAFVYLAALSIVGFILTELTIYTIENPSLWIVTVDLALFFATVYLLTRKKLRDGLITVWKQLSRSL